MIRVSKKDPQHYVDNKKLFEEMKKFKMKCKDADAIGEDMPPVPSYVGECFLKIANGLSYRPNFINYTYRDEMISDGIENCLQYVYNFDVEKSKNPFAYFTQIIYYAFIRRIQKEKKQTHIKHKIIEKQEFRTHDTLPVDSQTYSIQGFDATVMLPDEPVYKTKEKEKVEKPTVLEEFMEEE
tara:strand:+ start:1102 stop:1647 length:546 start_codon:yes stop_codon:yes gene_type:complete